MKKRLVVVFTTLVVLGLTAAVSAHAISIWAEVKGGKVVVDVFTSGGTKVQGAKVYVLDETGKVLLEGITDDQGGFTFDPPVKADMTIVVKLGDEGHAHTAETKIKKAEFDVPQSATPPSDATPTSEATPQ